MEHQINKQIDEFFKQYVDRFNQALAGEIPDVEGTAASFAGCFIEASPLGVSCGKNDEQFRGVIPQGYAFYRSIGVTAMEIIYKEITHLDEFHIMVKVRWKSKFTKKDHLKDTIEFEVIYLLQGIKNMLKIFAYITGDEQQALKEKGLI